MKTRKKALRDALAAVKDEMGPSCDPCYPDSPHYLCAMCEMRADAIGAIERLIEETT